MAAKVPYPRQLNSNESLDSLTHWKSHVRNYFRRDDNLKGFFARTFTWTPTAENYGFVGDDAEAKADNLEGLLDTICGFMPGPYLTAQITRQSKSMKDVFDFIWKHYDVEPNPCSFLDFHTLSLAAEERYIDLYYRMLYHADQHVVKAGELIDGVQSAADEIVTNSHKNLIALNWLQKISVHLVAIVKLEKHAELKAGKQLHTLVHDISKNIDEWLRRHGYDVPRRQTSLKDDSKNSDSTVRNLRSDQFYRGTDRGNFNKPRFTSRSPNQFPRPRYATPGSQTPGPKFFCPGCNYLAQELKLDVNFKHLPAQCPRKKSVLRLLHAEEQELDDQEEDVNEAAEEELDQQVAQVTGSLQTPSINQDDHVTQSNTVPNVINAVWKSKSPTVSLSFQSKPVTAVIDEGSEISAIDSKLVDKFHISISRTVEAAKAAGSIQLPVVGITKEDVCVTKSLCNSNVTWNLGQCLVIPNLGCDILIGEPAKAKNNILTQPMSKTIETLDSSSNPVVLSYASEVQMASAKINMAGTIFPGEAHNLSLPASHAQLPDVVIQPAEGKNYPTPGVYTVKNGQVRIPYNDQLPLYISRNDIFFCTSLLSNANTVKKIYSLNKENMQQFQYPNRNIVKDPSEINNVSIDPDNLLSSHWKSAFSGLVQSYSDIIDQVPGRYNGAFGQVNCTLTLNNTPPPSVKPRLPNYSEDKLRIMADIIDDMEAWGVVAKPETLGVVPTHVHPCILVPKSEGKYRLVTDFRSIQDNIVQLPTIMPTVQDAMTALSSSNYHVELDFSNYYWQNAIPREDSEKLAICHPYGGLRVYTVLPQGLRNSAEWGSEILSRIYGDMVRDGKCTRIADQVYVLGSSPEELAANFNTVLYRARKANLTFKPSKILICPSNTVILGWKKEGNFWSPTSHIISPLSLAEPPSTVKKLRGWLGAYRQIAKTIPKHAVILQDLEKIVAGKNSKEKIPWSPQLLSSFDNAKKSLALSKPITIPRPTDTLKIYTDWSQDADAVGGRLVVERMDGDTLISLHGGEFSCRLKGAQSRWTPCEKECLAIKLLIQHYQPFIRENIHFTKIFTDNIVAVHAWNAVKLGKISTSSRVASFISTLCENRVDILHVPGVSTKVADYNSRHPVHCSEPKCQTCSFLNLQIDLQESVVRSLQVNSDASLPLTQRPTWHQLQKDDPTHSQLFNLIQKGLPPEKKSRNKSLKLLHNMYRRGLLFIASDGLIQVKHADVAHNVEYEAISIPEIYAPGLIQSLHLKLNHPSPHQLMKQVSRQFYCVGMAKIVNSISSSCDTCCRLKTLPKEAKTHTTQLNEVFGKNFSADILIEKGSHLLICREKLSQFTLSRFVQDETQDSVQEALITLLVDIIPDSGATVQVDPGPSFVSLANTLDQSVLADFGIKLDIGRIHNKQKNPVAENAIKEFRKEWLRYKPDGSALSEIDRAKITSIINRRIRLNGLAPKEFMLKRQCSNHEPIQVVDSEEGKQQFERRQKVNETQFVRDSVKLTPPSNYLPKVGDRIFIKEDLSKSRAREEYMVVKIFIKDNQPWITARKTQKGFRNKEYLLKLSEIIPAPFGSTTVDSDDSEVLDEDDMCGFHQDINISRRDKLAKLIEILEQQTNHTRSRGRPRKARYPDYLKKLDEDVQIDENDERLCGFPQEELDQAREKKQKLKSIIEQMEEKDTPFYGFSDDDIEKTTANAQKLQDFMKTDLSNTVRQVCSKTPYNTYPWNYDEWLSILESDLFEDDIMEKKKKVLINDSIDVASMSYDDTELEFYYDLTDEEHALQSSILHEVLPFEAAEIEKMDLPIRTSTPTRKFRSETDPMYVDKIPVVSSSDSSIEEEPTKDQQTENECFPVQRPDPLYNMMPPDRVMNMDSVLSQIHEDNPAFQEIVPNRVYRMDEILTNVQELEALDDARTSSNSRPVRTSRRKINYKE